MEMRKMVVGAVVLALVVAVSGIWQTAWAGPDRGMVRTSHDKIGLYLKEIRQSVHLDMDEFSSSRSAPTRGVNKSETLGSGRSETVKKSRTGKKPGGRMAVVIITALSAVGTSDKIMVETRNLESRYRSMTLKKGSKGQKYVRTISNEAQTIKRLTQSLGPNPSAPQVDKYLKRVSESLRRATRAHDGHKEWIDVLNTDWGKGKSDEEIHSDKYGRVKSKLPNNRDTKGVAPTPGSTARPGSRKGNVETEWKVEKGQ